MKNCRVLIVSESPLFTDAISRLLAEANINVVAVAKNLEEARTFLGEQEIDAIVIDHNDAQPQDTEIVGYLISNSKECQIIFLTMAGNQMIVHHREQIENVTPADLVDAVRFSKDA